MESIILVIKGFFIGVANVIPGVSGGTIALILGVYEKLIDTISNIRKQFKKNLKFLIPLAIGMVVAIVTTSKLISYSYDKFPLPTIMFFVGLVFGGIPMLLKHVKGKKETKQLSSYIIALLTFLLVLFLASYKFLFSMTGEVSFESLGVIGTIFLFVVGIIASATMVIPGVSGSLVLMIIGYYYPIIDTINNLFKEDFVHNAFILCVLGLGIVFGIVMVSKLLNLLFKKYNTKTYFGILGFVFASIVAIPLAACIELNTITMTIDHIVISIIMLVAGTIISYNLGDK